jgi:adenylate kinase family enzyme
MRLEEIADKPIILVSGRLCSGKGTYCSQLANKLGKKHIVTSDIVKMISGFNKRSDLHTTKSLDQQIADELIRQIYANDGEVIVDGIRQQSIIERILERFGEKNVELRWLHVDPEELERRFYDRADKKDDQDFETATELDRHLGIDDVESYITNHPAGSVINNM